MAGGAAFAPGAFWKRLDTITDGKATGRVVNYDIHALPGDPVVRAAIYPDDNRRYLRKGDQVLLLTYRNDPYKPVYDVIKLVDENNAIGVMHLGEYPNGFEFATFVMSRYSYPLERMSADDHRLLFARPDLVARDAGPDRWRLGGTPHSARWSRDIADDRAAVGAAQFQIVGGAFPRRV